MLRESCQVWLQSLHGTFLEMCLIGIDHLHGKLKNMTLLFILENHNLAIRIPHKRTQIFKKKVNSSTE